MEKQPEEMFAERLPDMRAAAGLTQRQLATAAKMHHSAIAKIELGQRSVSLNEASRIVHVLGVPLDFFVGPLRTLDAREAVLHHRALWLQSQREAIETELGQINDELLRGRSPWES